MAALGEVIPLPLPMARVTDTGVTVLVRLAFCAAATKSQRFAAMG
jgi:hypothetical protein